jgi:predicted nucleic acid-binding protein
VIVLDSSFLIAFHNERDSQHDAARGLMREFLEGRWGKGLLPEYVFLEVATVLLVRRDLATAVRTGRLLLEAQDWTSCRVQMFFLRRCGFSVRRRLRP